MTKKLSSTACIRLLPGDVMRFVLPGCHPIEGLCLGGTSVAPWDFDDVAGVAHHLTYFDIIDLLNSIRTWGWSIYSIHHSTSRRCTSVFLAPGKKYGWKSLGPHALRGVKEEQFPCHNFNLQCLKMFEGCLAPKRRFRNFKLQFWKGVSHKTCFWEIADVRNRMVVKTKRKSRTKMCFWMFLRDSRCTKTYVFEEEMCLEQSKSRCEELRRTEKSWEDVKRTKWTEKAISRASAPRTGFARHPIGTFIGFNMFNWRWVVQAYAWHSSGTTRRCSGRGKLGSSILTAVAITSPYVPWSKHRL